MDTIYTVGHGRRSLAEFIAVLRSAGVKYVVDVRSFPRSRTNPQFNQDTLPAALAARGLVYHAIPGLGGWRHTAAGHDSPHTSLQVESFRAYADHMSSREFMESYSALVKLARAAKTAFFCSETVWFRCHRRMIADLLTANGWQVLHLGMGRLPRAHILWDAARIEPMSGHATDCDDALRFLLVYDKPAKPPVPRKRKRVASDDDD